MRKKDAEANNGNMDEDERDKGNRGAERYGKVWENVVQSRGGADEVEWRNEELSEDGGLSSHRQMWGVRLGAWCGRWREGSDERGER